MAKKKDAEPEVVDDNPIDPETGEDRRQVEARAEIDAAQAAARHAEAKASR